MNSTLVRAASLGFLALGAPLLGNAAAGDPAVLHAMSSEGSDFAALVGSDDAVNTKALLETSPYSVLDSSGCMNVVADTSGLVGWYAEPVVPAHSAFAANESMGIESAVGGNTIAVLSQTRVAIFELNTQGFPEFATLTPADVASFERQLAVSPDGREIAVSDTTGTITFFRRSESSGWAGATAAQVLTSGVANLTGKALTYSGDGTQLYVEGRGTDLDLRIFQRGNGGNWQLAGIDFPGTLNTAPSRALGWSSDRLLVSDLASILVYKRLPNGLEFSHTLEFSAQPSQLNVYPGGFSVHVGQFIQFYNFNGMTFTQSFVRFANVVDEAAIPTNLPVFVGAASPAPNVCSSVRFFGPSGGFIGSYFLPNGFNQPARSVVAGPWGVLATAVSPSGAGEVYFIAQDRIFGGQNPPLGAAGKGQGGFE